MNRDNKESQMALTPDKPGAADALARPPQVPKGLTASDIDADEVDDVIMCIFKELRKQLSQMESKEAEQLTTTDRERHARILASLQRTAEKLAKVEASRAAARKSHASNQDGTALEALKRELSRVTGVEFARRGSRAPDERSA
jgi:hypothetical protein